MHPLSVSGFPFLLTSLQKECLEQIVYRTKSWRKIFYCWRRVGAKLKKNFKKLLKREGVFLFCEGVLSVCFQILRFAQDDTMFSGDFKKGLEIHVTHCTIVVIRWISMFLRAMCLFFTCHWCHFAGSSDMSDMRFFLSLHGDVLIISELYVSCNEWHEFHQLEFLLHYVPFGMTKRKKNRNSFLWVKK